MYVRVVTSKQKHKTYRSVQIVDSYRDPAKSKHPITRIIAHLGQVDTLTDRDVDNIINGMCKAIGRPTSQDTTVPTAFDFGHVFAIAEIWKRLKIDAMLQRYAHRGAHDFDLAKHIQLMVTNRLCDPCSKLGLLQWLEGVYFPGVDRDSVAYHHLLRTMDWLIEHKEQIERDLAHRFITLFTQDVDLVFYDITSSYVEGQRSITEDDIRSYGYSRDHRPDRRQIVIGIVMTKEGIPLCHHVFAGSTADSTTVTEVVNDLKKRFRLSKVVFVGDRGMLSEDNLDFLLNQGFGFIVAHRLRRNTMITDFVKSTHHELNHDTDAKEQYRIDRRQGVSLVMAYDPAMAAILKKQRQDALTKADAVIKELKRRLQRSREGQLRGRPLTAQGALLAAHDYLTSHRLTRYYHLELTDDRDLKVTADTKARRWESLIDGKLIVETTLGELPPQEVIARYKELALVEQAFKCLKSSLQLRPMYHWTECRIRAHVFICVMALQIERYMRLTLQDMKLSASGALEKLRQIKAGQILVNSVKTPMLTNATSEHKAIYKQLKIPFPTINRVQNM